MIRRISNNVFRTRWLILLVLPLMFACNGFEVVIDDLSQREANEALVLLRDINIPARKSEKASKKTILYQIEVKKSHAQEALKILVHNQFPKVYRVGLKEVFPPGGQGLIPTKTDELARMMMAMQGEIEALLKVIPGIADARVLISYDGPADFGKHIAKKTASAAVIYNSSTANRQAPLSDSEIKNLIATSISGMLPDDVTVVQKMIEPIPEEKIARAPSIISKTAKTKTEQPLAPYWYLWGLTGIALLIAAYAVVRIFLEKRHVST
jgi:type III secretion system YscJ/HrcJ family lipoprotein